MATTRSVRVLAAGFTASLVLVSAGPAFAAPNDTVNGSAFGASVEVAGASVLSPQPMVTLPADGAAQSATLASVGVPSLLNTGVLNVSTSGSPANGSSTSTAEVLNVQVLPSLIGPSVLSASAVRATCTSTPTSDTGSTTLTNIALSNGTAVAVTPTPNQTVNLVGLGTVVFNEQKKNADGSFTVNAVHVTLLPGVPVPGSAATDIIIASATCGPNVAAPPINAIPTAGLPLAAGIVAAFVLGVVVMRRREMGPFAA